ncbi:UDP-glucose dehydrogenase family protein [Syntrophomonas wolfei]|uniref:UDP-glucose dehydrogenase family protein n=1 Tax=Syntrophomonas wolfei TaxID=863 RepID=UPI0023F439DB|nr:UDP-glucose/GDP-mannose dehydrogenase family protein [Syntrophomonas wolfei]
MYNKRIAIVGTGYVGLVQGICMADFGLKVLNVDLDEEKIIKLKSGKIPIYEPGLSDKFERVLKKGSIDFTTDIIGAIEECEVIFIAVGTPPNENWTADLQNVFSVAKSIGTYMNDYKVIVTKSTVPVGTGRKIKTIVQEQLDDRGVKYDFNVASNPEFLREGKAVQDFMVPDRVVIGSDDERAIEILKSIYRPLNLNQVPFVITDLESSEMIKYASNAFLATKVAFINEVANLCEKLGADVHMVAKGMGMDGRIGSKFLHPGPGYGGSCFPKDTRALVAIAQEAKEALPIIEIVITSNENQKKRMVKKICNAMGDVGGKTIGVLGLTFKAETDDIRESPAIVIITELLRLGANIKAYDPEGIPNYKTYVTNARNITYCFDEYEVAKGADALVIITEWNEFRQIDLVAIAELMNDKYIFDFRNMFDPQKVREMGYHYESIGRK